MNNITTDKEKLINGMLKKKPDFSMPLTSSILEKAKQFLPEFKKDTDSLLQDPTRMSKECIENIEENKRVIEMNIAVGVYDVKEGEESKLEDLLKQSTTKMADVIITSKDGKTTKNKRKRKTKLIQEQ